MDGKHIVIQAPSKSGSAFYNYKGSHSVVLMAVCDAHYHFLLVDIGDSGRHSDGGVLAHSDFGKALLERKLAFPEDCALPGTTSPQLPFTIVADKAFPLKPNIMRPYLGWNLPKEQNVFNYRLSRACRTIENAFGIQSARWRIFREDRLLPSLTVLCFLPRPQLFFTIVLEPRTQQFFAHQDLEMKKTLTATLYKVGGGWRLSHPIVVWLRLGVQVLTIFNQF